MKIDGFVKFLLLVIAIFLGIIALRPYVAPPRVEAQSTGAYYPMYIEHGFVWLPSPKGGSVAGRLVLDLRTGNIWGFPGFTQDTFEILDKKLPTSHPVLLGKWELADMDKTDKQVELAGKRLGTVAVLSIPMKMGRVLTKCLNSQM
ncbi:MAG: hypothetical protein WAO35_08510 [Terriglobia bacterium]